MIKINVVTPLGILFQEEVEMVIFRNNEGEQAILQNHIPIVVTLNPGYVRLQRNNETLYVTVVGGFLEFSNNVVNVIAQEAEVGRDHENALKHLAELRKRRFEENKKRNIDFTRAEREIREELKKIKASKYL
ncbi:MAG: ATP synthase F1 subunit epsilon [Bacilli bacterium]|nr:ATP synthase F1 subunit epsilon [Bacilli bacterium]